MSRKWKWVSGALGTIFLLYLALFTLDFISPICTEKSRYHDMYFFLRYDIWEPGHPHPRDCPARSSIITNEDPITPR